MLVLKLAATVLLISSITCGRTYNSSLADCQAFASTFDNTCDNTATPTSVSSTAGASVTCSQTDKCIGTVSGDTCTFTRKLCVTCSQINEETYIRVQSNGFPPHCYFRAPDDLVEQDYDFIVKFQPTIDGLNSEADSQEQLNNLICDISVTRSDNINSVSNFTQIGTSDMITAAGFARNGVIMLNGISGEGVDPIYPAAYGRVSNAADAEENFDICLSHPNPTGAYHYHSVSPCLFDYTSSNPPSMCPDNVDCEDDPIQYALDSLAAYKELTPMGIAKDGNIIWGPYKDDGTLWESCDVDICNGAYIDGTHYGYALTTFHPYIIGCFGPGTTSSLSQECSSNPHACSQATLVELAGIVVGAALAFIAL